MKKIIKNYRKYSKITFKNFNLLINFFLIIILNINSNYEVLYYKQIKKEIKKLNNYYKICNDGILLNRKQFKKINNPKVSIIIAVYNSEKTILRLLRSIQNQFFDEIEIIFIDDCSKDKTVKLIQNFQKEDQRIILIKNHINEGTLISRNKGVFKSSGEYLIIPDSDDLLEKDIINICYKIATKYNYEMVRYNAYEEQQNFINIIKKLESRPIYQPELSTYIFYGLGDLHLHEFTMWNKLIKREAFIRALNDIDSYYLNQHMLIYEDGLINYALYRNIKSFYLIKKIGYYYIFNGKTSIQYKQNILKNLPKYIFLYIKFILDNSKNTKYEKDMAVYLFHIYSSHIDLIYLINENFDLYNYVIDSFFNYKYISLEDKKKLKHLKNIIHQKEKNITQKILDKS